MNKLLKYIETIANIPSIHPNEENVRSFIISILNSINKTYKVDDLGNLYSLSKYNSETLLSAHMDKQAPPNFKDLGNCIQGKLDDAVGIGIILMLLEKFDCSAFFSVGEEGGLRGSKYALKNGLIPKVENVIVIDTSPFGELGNGPVFYTSFGNNQPSTKFINEIFYVAKLINVNLQPMDGSINDGINLIRAIPDTIALEPHIDNYHTSEEISAKIDITNVYKMLELYFKRNLEKGV